MYSPESGIHTNAVFPGLISLSQCLITFPACGLCGSPWGDPWLVCLWLP